MKRGDIWRDPLPGSIIAWIFVTTFLVIPAIFARLEPLALVATLFAGAMAFSPVDSRLRKIGLVLFPLAAFLSFLPAVPTSAAWQVALLFAPLTIIAIDVAREQGVVLPILRFVRSPRVRSWAAVLGLTPLVIFYLASIERTIATSGLPPIWRWSVLPLALLAAAPASWFGGPWRSLWGAIPFLAMFMYVGSHPKDKLWEAAFQQIGLTPLWTLAAADYVHAGWATIRKPKAEAKPENPRPGLTPTRVSLS